MTGQTVIELMVAERNIASGTSEHRPALTTFDRRRIRPSGTENQDLLVSFQPCGHSLQQDQGKRTLHRILSSFLPHVHQHHRTVFSSEIPVHQGHKAQSAGLHIVEALKRRRRRAQQHRAAHSPAQHQGGIAAMISRSLVGLLIRRVVLPDRMPPAHRLLFCAQRSAGNDIPAACPENALRAASVSDG